MRKENKNHINTGQGTTDEMVNAMFKEGGIPAIMTTNDADTKDDQELMMD